MYQHLKYRCKKKALFDKKGKVIKNSNYDGTYIHNFGEENTRYLTHKNMEKIISKCYNSIPKLIEKLNFDEKHPENHTIVVNVIRSSYILVRKDNKWIFMLRRECIDELLEFGRALIIKEYENRKNKLKKKTIRAFQNYYEHCYDEKTNEIVRKEILLLLLNKRNVPIKTKKVLEQQKSIDNIKNKIYDKK